MLPVWQRPQTNELLPISSDHNDQFNSKRSIKENAMLDTRFDSMFIRTGIAKQLCLKGIDQEIFFV